MSRRANRPAPKRDVAARPADSAATLAISSRPFSGGRGRGGGTSPGFAVDGEDLETDVHLTIRDVLTGVSRRIDLTERVVPARLAAAVPSCVAVPVSCAAVPAPKLKNARSKSAFRPACRHDTRVRLAGKGQPGINGGKPGDLYLRVHIQANGVFRQKGFDIQVTLPVWPWEAALGAEVMAPT
jgi:DnaJ-class molecular chaperone